MALSASVLAVAAVVGTVLFTFIRRLYSIGQREPLLPPGPPTKPLLGNLTILPIKDVYLRFGEWAEQYGEIFSLKVASKTTIVLSSFEAVYEIMDKNGLKTADRTNRAHMIRIFGDDVTLSNISYGPTFRRWRRAANDMTSPSACEKHMPILLAEINQLMSDLLNRPEDFLESLQRMTMSTSFAIVFGARALSVKSHDVETFLRTSHELIRMTAPGEVPPVELLPILHLIPDKYARNWRARADAIKRDQEEMWFRHTDRIYERLKQGVSNGCLTETLIERAEEGASGRRTVAYMSGSFLRASTHTTTAALQWFTHLVTVYQDAQKKLREEMDRVVGPSRLPNGKDIPNLPYLRAFIREAMRFRTVVPLGVPHVANEDQMYKGYLIPKGATLFFHSWKILHDPDIFDDPNVFNPDRFLNIDPSKVDMYKKLESLPFGVGRRICPGMFLANRVLEMTAASLIWGFEFTPSAEGGPDVNNFRVDMTCEPLPFKCVVKPRTSEKAKIVENNLPASQVVFEKFAT